MEVSKKIDEVKDLTPKKETPVKKNHKWQRDKDQEPVKGIFRFFEVPGGQMEFVFKAWKEDKVETYKLRDGHHYTLPLGVAKHLNKNLWYPIHHYAQDADGKPLMKINQRVRRCAFQSLEFIDIEDLAPAGKELVTVEYTSL